MITNDSRFCTVETFRGTINMTAGTVKNSGTGKDINNLHGTIIKTGGTAEKIDGIP